MRTGMTTGMIVFMGLAAAGCARDVETGTTMPDGRTATAQLRTSTGADAGRATATEVAGGIRYTIDARGVPAGSHGVHVHMVGRCDAPDFMTAGAHWNPGGRQHGTMNPQGPHSGDLPNLIVGADGRGTVGITVAGATMDGLLDADGSTMMIHAAADDLRTDPSGNSGGRIACGLFRAG